MNKFRKSLEKIKSQVQNKDFTDALRLLKELTKLSNIRIPQNEYNKLKISLSDKQLRKFALHDIYNLEIATRKFNNY